VLIGPAHAPRKGKAPEFERKRFGSKTRCNGIAHGSHVSEMSGMYVGDIVSRVQHGGSWKSMGAHKITVKVRVGGCVVVWLTDDFW